MIGFKRLSSEAISKYNYVATKKNVDRFMDPLYELVFKYKNISPPSIGMRIREVNIQHINNPLSPVENYVIKKIDTEEQVKEYYEIIQTILKNLREDEQICFKSIYFDGLTESDCCEVLNVTINTISAIRKSATIKFALALDIAVLKGEK